MKSIVVSDDFDSVDLKPKTQLQEYKQLLKSDLEKLMATNLQNILSPTSQKPLMQKAFEQHHAQYYKDSNCGSLFVVPRPTDEAIYDYYKHSVSRVYWRDQLSQASSLKRKEKILKPRFQWMLDSTQEYHPHAQHWLDVNTFDATYVQAMASTEFFSQKTLLNPFLDTSSLDIGTIQIQDQPYWIKHAESSVDVVTLFETLDHTSDVTKLLESVHTILKPGGLCFVTSILSSGFDVQVLWDKAENIYPPDRLNVFSAQGLQNLFEQNGFDVLEFSTPGILDLDIVKQVVKSNPDVSMPRFIRTIVQSNDEFVQDSFQEFLQTSLLSSYGRMLVRVADKV